MRVDFMVWSVAGKNQVGPREFVWALVLNPTVRPCFTQLMDSYVFRFEQALLTMNAVSHLQILRLFFKK